MKSLALALLAILTALRLWLAAILVITPLEAYFWMCANRLDRAFFDGPPGTAALMHFTIAIFGDDPLGLRVAFPVFALLASGGAFLLGRALFGSAVGWWTAIALNTLPFFNTASVHAGPALPTLAFTLLAAWALVRALKYGLFWWLLAGFFVSLGTQFHYAATLLPLGAILACTLSPQYRIEWQKPGLYLALGIALAGLLPAFTWNQAHGWPTLALGTLQTAFTPRWHGIVPALVDNLATFSLPALVALAAAVWLLVRTARLRTRPKLILGLAAPFLAGWLYEILHGQPSPILLLLAFTLLAVGAAYICFENSLLRKIGTVLLLLTAISTALISYGGDPWSRSTHGIAWQEAASALDSVLARAQPAQAQPLLLIAQNPDATAVLNYHLSRTSHPEVFLRESQDASNQFSLWPRYDDFVTTDLPPDDFFKNEGSATNPYVGRSALYVSDEEPADLPQAITAAFARVSSFASLELPGGRKLHVYLCEDYQTMPL